MTKQILAILMLLMVGMGMIAGGVFLLAGLGWALVVGALPFIAAGGVLLRGLSRAG